MALVKSIFTLLLLCEAVALPLAIVVTVAIILVMMIMATVQFSVPSLRRRMMEKNTQMLKEMKQARGGKYGKRQYRRE